MRVLACGIAGTRISRLHRLRDDSGDDARWGTLPVPIGVARRRGDRLGYLRIGALSRPLEKTICHHVAERRLNQSWLNDHHPDAEGSQFQPQTIRPAFE